ncbi:hypothetical protein K7H09_13940 [Halomonas sp. IOP_14]|uniref:hypothetical protein n=1 Tax=Halomonas sp. IOP_14 TaxID=2873295 RepID=UPI001E3B0190|nr:hypothetical protein [Halomonas sp. IOP_14]MCD1587113.1 hypothetical protein [Halomonas sp. IOP_14]|tara:strand:+ start:5646 stop:5864 length:219 start_codon:yes stop_codon:yes gene_type:complete
MTTSTGGYRDGPTPSWPAKSLPSPDGTADMIHRGEIRDGGDYQTRMSRIAVWNIVMDEHNYLVRRWNDFMSA